jgi:hypothetical protein
LIPGAPVPSVHSRARPDGFELTLRWPRAQVTGLRADGTLPFDLVMNERPAHRERRRGQLILSGGGGFAYLRGDRHTPAVPVVLQLP